MQTSGVSSQDQWARFMQLSNAARVRNQGLASSASGAVRAGVAPRTSVSPQRSAGASFAVPTSPGINRSYGQVRSAAPTRILGGAFDAYA
jgi:hypothetical protein